MVVLLGFVMVVWMVVVSVASTDVHLVAWLVVSKVVRMDDQMVDGRVASLVLDWVDL